LSSFVLFFFVEFFVNELRLFLNWICSCSVQLEPPSADLHKAYGSTRQGIDWNLPTPSVR
jgi:hypothetical protein